MPSSAIIQCLRTNYSVKKGGSILYQCIPTYRARKVQNTVTATRKTLKQVGNCETQTQVVSSHNSTLKRTSKIMTLRNQQKSIYEGQCITIENSSRLKYYKNSFQQQSLFVQFLHISIILHHNKHAITSNVVYATTADVTTCRNVQRDKSAQPYGNTHN